MDAVQTALHYVPFVLIFEKILHESYVNNWMRVEALRSVLNSDEALIGFTVIMLLRHVGFVWTDLNYAMSINLPTPCICLQF